jgi:hypothetical protein
MRILIARSVPLGRPGADAATVPAAGASQLAFSNSRSQGRQQHTALLKSALHRKFARQTGSPPAMISPRMLQHPQPSTQVFLKQVLEFARFWKQNQGRPVISLLKWFNRELKNDQSEPE